MQAVSRAGLNEDDVSIMAKSGCASVGFGVESGSPRMLRFINKSADLKTMEESFWLLVKHNILPKIYLISELPTETIEDFEKTQALLKRLDNPPYQYVSYLPYPGTEMFNYCVKKGLTPPKSLKEWAEFISVPNCGIRWSKVPKKMIAKAKKRLIRYYFWRRLAFAMRHRLFSYYTPVSFSLLEVLRVFKFWWRYYVTRPINTS